MTVVAYCWASGEIDFGKKCPRGALPLNLRGTKEALIDFISGVARKAYKPDLWLVPGLPEAPNQSRALDALIKFSNCIDGQAKAAGLR